jgi:hypothetical protein
MIVLDMNMFVLSTHGVCVCVCVCGNHIALHDIFHLVLLPMITEIVLVV